MSPSCHGRSVRNILMRLFAVLVTVAGAVGPADAFVIFGTKWPPGPVMGTPGAVSFSVMPLGSVMDPFDTGLSTNFGALITQGANQNEVATVLAAFNTWAAAPTNLTNLGVVPDNGANFNAAPGDPRGLLGPFGDLRMAAVDITTAGVLAHAYFPPPNLVSASGDLHFDNTRLWSDDATDTNADPDFDFFTVALHELGHSLGLNHTAVPGSVMNPFYGGGRRSLGLDDIAGIQFIYGGGDALPPCVPPPSAYAAAQHRYPGFDINKPIHAGFPRCDPLPRAQAGGFSVHNFDSIFEGDVDLPGLGPTHVLGSALTNVEVKFDRQVGNRFFYTTEITQLDIRGDPSLGVPYEGIVLPPNIVIRQDPDRPSVGEIVLDGSMLLTSFFDVFTELSIDGGQTFVKSIGSTHMETSFGFTPEPSTWLLLATGFLGLLGYTRRGKKRLEIDGIH